MFLPTGAAWDVAAPHLVGATIRMRGAATTVGSVLVGWRLVQQPHRVTYKQVVLPKDEHSASRARQTI